MPTLSEHVRILTDQDGQAYGVHLSPELWAAVKDTVTPIFNEAIGVRDEPDELPEPLADWEFLTQYWDFPYPVDYDVACDNCQSATDHWQQDEPRKFRLRAANLGGLCNFECTDCGSRILKRHFKDKITSETRPPAD